MDAKQTIKNILGNDCISVPVCNIGKRGHGDALSVKIVLPTACQANCSFCFNKVNKDSQQHDFEKFKTNLKQSLQILKQNLFNRTITLDITGNEPTFNVELLQYLLDTIKEFKGDFVDKVVMTTNGYKLLEFANLDPIDIVNVSLHHYDYEKRKEVFKTKLIPNDDQLKCICKKFNTTAVAVCDETCEDLEDFTINFAEFAKNTGFKNVRIRTDYLSEGSVFYKAFKDAKIEHIVGLDKKELDFDGYSVNLYRGVKDLTDYIAGVEVIIDDDGKLYLDYYKRFPIGNEFIQLFDNTFFIKNLK